MATANHTEDQIVIPMAVLLDRRLSHADHICYGVIRHLRAKRGSPAPPNAISELAGMGPVKVQKSMNRLLKYKFLSRGEVGQPEDGKIDKALFAQEMRHNPTPSEASLWDAISDCSLGVRFKQQVVIRGYIADFYCKRHKLAVEVDGASHRGREEYDATRDDAFLKLGIRTLRLPAALVTSDLNAAVRTIRDKLTMP